MYPDLDDFTGPEFDNVKFKKNHIAVFFDDDFINHKTGNHPEHPRRLIVTRDAILNHEVNSSIDWKSPRICDDADILRCHTSGHLHHVKEICQEAENNPEKLLRLDPDTVVSAGSLIAAKKAVGAMCDGIDLLKSGEYEIAWALVRPPGHHAIPERSMGFCLFNNAACGAEYARAVHNYEKILILDFDAHHGNGTQDIFYDDHGVLYMSIHQSYHYPGTGFIDQIGSGRGRGYTVNFPILASSGNDEFALFHKEVFAPIALQFKPELIIVSAGFDAHAKDPLCMLQVTTSMFRAVMTLIRTIAHETNAHLLYTLEGGYSLEALSESIVEGLVASTNGSFSEHDLPMRGRPSPGAMETLDRLREALKGVWEL